MQYVLSDIHGNEERFLAMLEKIHFGPEDTLYILGDVIDRHPHGLRILRRIMAMPNAHMLLGNHEYMMLRALGQPRDENRDDGRAMAHWYRNGGDVTHRHFKHLRKTLRQQLLDYLLSLPLELEVRLGDRTYLLVHGAPPGDYDGNLPYLNPVHYAVWKRLEADHPLPADQILVFGHTPTCHYRDIAPMEVWYGENRIGIDCGCGYPENGRLACLRLEDGNVFYVS
jgi:serine/threonine protein phosphatase 1